MAWHVIRCPKCGGYTPARPTVGQASAAWREHVIRVHLGLTRIR